MAKTPADFVAHVQWAATHRDAAQRQAKRLWEHILEARTIERTIGAWREALAGP